MDLRSRTKLRVESDEALRIGRNAVRKARKRLREKGIPLSFVRDGKLLFEMPDGSITDRNPFDNDADDKSGT